MFTCNYHFPDPDIADPEEHGFIALGGDLEPSTLMCAYSKGLFPWFNEGEPIAWWSPSPRCVVYPDSFTPSRSLKKSIRKSGYWLTVNRAFEEVITNCAYIRAETDGTWITEDMIQAYTKLHEMGDAHSLEVWSDEPLKKSSELIGGIYGLKIGTGFFGESMFHKRTDTSKMAFSFLAKLCTQSGIEIIDCQLENPHLMSLGAHFFSRDTFLNDLKTMITSTSSNWSYFSQNNFCFPVKRLLDNEYNYYISDQ